MTRKQTLQQTKMLADHWYNQHKSMLYIQQQKERRGL